MLLTRFAAGGDAAAAYESLRRRLIAYFRLAIPVQAEALADTALDRLAKRLGEGVVVDNLSAYLLGIARLVLLEARAQAVRQQQALRLEMAGADIAWTGADDDADEQRLHDALEACLQRLGHESRRLILGYYGTNDSRRIPARRQMAEHLGITTHALRNRALRLRAALENCVRGRLQAAPP